MLILAKGRKTLSQIKVTLLPCQFILEGKTIKEHSGPSINL
jgi:hypothetical protein